MHKSTFFGGKREENADCVVIGLAHPKFQPCRIDTNASGACLHHLMFKACELWKVPEYLSFDKCCPSFRPAVCLTHPTISTRFEDICYFCDNPRLNVNTFHSNKVQWRFSNISTLGGCHSIFLHSIAGINRPKTTFIIIPTLHFFFVLDPPPPPKCRV